MSDVNYRCPECGNRDSAPEGYWRGDPPCSAGPPCDCRMKEVIEPGAMSDNEAIRYRLEALGWKRKYRKLQTETAERLEKLQPWMVEWLRHEAAQADTDDLPEWAKAGEQVAAAIQHAIGEDDA